MGRDKGLLPLPGDAPLAITFVEHHASLLAPLCGECILVARDAMQATQYAQYHLPSLQIITDNIPDTGPLMGLYSGLSAMQSTHALVCAIDMPLIQPELLIYLLSHELDDTLLIPRVADIPQVLLAIYPRSCLPVIDACLRKGRRDLRALLQEMSVHYIEEAQLRSIDAQLCSFTNVNTPDDWSQLSQAGR
jgi:molybdenum cofactor guanylyltransferase